MDEIFTEALNGSETGQAYRSLAAKRSGETNAEERHRAWEAFAAAFKNDYSDRLTQAATDETSKQALAALAVYVERNAALDSGAIPEFADQQGAEEALKRGEKPEVNPAYTQALADTNPYSLRNYLYQLQEQLGYVLTNLDSENMSENFLSSKGETE